MQLAIYIELFIFEIRRLVAKFMIMIKIKVQGKGTECKPDQMINYKNI